MSESLFAKATRKKLRFHIEQGLVSAEDLWDCNLSILNLLAIKLNREIKTNEEEDFLKEVPKVVTTTKLEFNVVIHILEVKKAEKQARLDATKNKENKDKLLAALVRKEDQAIDSMSREDIQKAIEAL